MRVKDCKKCKHCERKTWSSYYKPMNYHAIGMSHAYAYCDKYKVRVSEVHGCKEERNMTTKEVKAKMEKLADQIDDYLEKLEETGKYGTDKYEELLYISGGLHELAEMEI